MNMERIFSKVQEFLRLESSAGLLLMAAAGLALLANNSFLSGPYQAFLATPVVVSIGALEIAKPLLLWINDGLMAIFFFLVGLEIKREVLEGELSSFNKSALPILAALGGMAAPALIYVLVNRGDAAALGGWAIPAATDIAFALGVLALLGARVPVSLKIFLLALAIIDDLGAIVIIAIFYAGDLSLSALGLAAVGIVALAALNRSGVRKIAPYSLIGVFMWVCVLKSGVHATLAGVIAAMFVPIRPGRVDEQSPLHALEHGLHPWVAYLVLPLFAFANAGVPFKGLSVGDLFAPISLGVALGLFIGKQAGIFAIAFVAVKLKWARLPAGVGWAQLYGVSCLAGIGFTMSLFIGSLAFDNAQEADAARIGVLAGSLASAVLGYFILNAVLPPADPDQAPQA